MTKKNYCKICGEYSGKRKVCNECKGKYPYRAAPGRTRDGWGGGRQFNRKQDYIKDKLKEKKNVQ